MRAHVFAAIALGLFAASGASAQTTQPNSDAPSNAAVKDTHSTAAEPAHGANSFTQEQASEHIAEAGYTDVANLEKDENGVWRGTAKKAGKTVQVALDYKGNVTTE